MARKSMKSRFWLQILIALLVAVGGWAIFNFVRVILQNVFATLGITSEAGQSLAMVVLVVVVLASLGIGFRKSLKRLVQ